jgi:tRNA threonylcarbamoyladenosine biosynthesis protein TsaE
VEPGIVAIEWAERLCYRPENYLLIRLMHTPDGQRQATLMPEGSFDRQILAFYPVEG